MSEDDEMVARFIAERGVTRCPTAFVAVSQAELSEQDVLAHKLRGPDPIGDALMARARALAVAKGIRVQTALAIVRKAQWGAMAHRAAIERAAGRAQQQPGTPFPKPHGRPPRVFTPAEDAVIRRMRSEGMPIQGAIDKALGIDARAIARRAGELGLDTTTRIGSRFNSRKANTDTRAGAPQTPQTTADERKAATR